MHRWLPLCLFVGCAPDGLMPPPEPSPPPRAPWHAPPQVSGELPAPTACQGRSLLYVDDPHVYRIDADGTSRRLFSFADSRHPFGGGVLQDLQVRGRYIAGHVPSGYTGPTASFERHFTVIDLEGHELFQHTTVSHTPDYVQMWLGEDGSLAVADPEGGWVGLPGGEVVPLTDLWPVGPVLGNGQLPVTQKQPRSGMPWNPPLDRLFSLATMSTALPPTPLHDPSAWRVVGDRLFYFSEWYFIEVGGPHALAYVNSVDPEPLHPAQWMPLWRGAAERDGLGRFVLWGDSPYSTQPRMRLDRERRVVEPVSLRDQQPFFEGDIAYDPASISLDADGALLVAFELGDNPNATYSERRTLQLRRSTDLGHTFTDVGAPLPAGTDQPWGLTLNRGGSRLFASLSPWDTGYVHALRLSSPHGDFDLDVRTAMGWESMNGRGAELQLADLSPDGQCVATWVWSGLYGDRTEGDSSGTSTLLFLDSEGRTLRGPTMPIAGYLRFLP